MGFRNALRNVCETGATYTVTRTRSALAKEDAYDDSASPTLDSPLAPSSSSEPAPRLRGRWLLVARSVWLLLAAGLLANFLFGSPAYYAQLLTVCPDAGRTALPSTSSCLPMCRRCSSSACLSRTTRLPSPAGMWRFRCSLCWWERLSSGASPPMVWPPGLPAPGGVWLFWPRQYPQCPASGPASPGPLRAPFDPVVSGAGVLSRDLPQWALLAALDLADRAVVGGAAGGIPLTVAL